MKFGSRRRIGPTGRGRGPGKTAHRFRRRCGAGALLLALALLCGGCAGSAPAQPDNLCAIFREKPDWYRDAAEAGRKWDVPVPVIMAIMEQESKYRSQARPPRTRCLWIFPGPRPSSAYGYAQAIDGTWDWYQDRTGNPHARRDRFADAVDFIGWYSHVSHHLCGIAKSDASRLYLAYHEGHTGYNEGRHHNKPGLLGVAKKVARQAKRYSRQLRACQEGLGDRGPCFLWPF